MSFVLWIFHFPIQNLGSWPTVNICSVTHKWQVLVLGLPIPPWFSVAEPSQALEQLRATTAATTVSTTSSFLALDRYGVYTYHLPLWRGKWRRHIPCHTASSISARPAHTRMCAPCLRSSPVPAVPACTPESVQSWSAPVGMGRTDVDWGC